MLYLCARSFWRKPSRGVFTAYADPSLALIPRNLEVSIG